MKFEWQGDLEDDCSLRVGNLSAHVECLGDFEVFGEDGESDRMEYWHCCVGYVDEKGMAVGDHLFHAGEPGGLITSGSMARAIAEAIIRQASEVEQLRAKVTQLEQRLQAERQADRAAANEIQRLSEELDLP